MRTVRQTTTPSRSRSTYDSINVYVGGKLRLRRAVLGLTQQRLAKLLGVSFQQVQKYERGETRISSGRLFDLARILDVPLTYFFDDVPLPRRGRPVQPREEDTLPQRETLELIRAYHRIRSSVLRKRIRELTRALADTQSPSQR